MTDSVSGAQSSLRFHVGWYVEAALPDVPDKLGATLDKTTYQSLGSQAAQIIVKQQIASLPGYFANITYAAKSNVQGIMVVPTSYNCWLMNSFTTVHFGTS